MADRGSSVVLVRIPFALSPGQITGSALLNVRSLGKLDMPAVVYGRDVCSCGDVTWRSFDSGALALACLPGYCVLESARLRSACRGEGTNHWSIAVFYEPAVVVSRVIQPGALTFEHLAVCFIGTGGRVAWWPCTEAERSSISSLKIWKPYRTLSCPRITNLWFLETLRSMWMCRTMRAEGLLRLFDALGMRQYIRRRHTIAGIHWTSPIHLIPRWWAAMMWADYLTIKKLTFKSAYCL